jgi:hypothetical protein
MSVIPPVWLYVRMFDLTNHLINFDFLNLHTNVQHEINFASEAESL